MIYKMTDIKYNLVPRKHALESRCKLASGLRLILWLVNRAIIRSQWRKSSSSVNILAFHNIFWLLKAYKFLSGYVKSKSKGLRCGEEAYNCY
jgi:hypothetical protein